MKIVEELVNKGLDIFYSKNKIKFYVCIFFILGFIMRLIAANNLSMHPDDSIGAVMAIGILESGKLEEVGQSSALWSYVHNIFYNIFGTYMFASRIATAIFGALTVLLIYMFVKRVFKSEKIAFVASVLVGFSPFFIKMTLSEMDISATFFILLSGLFLLDFIEKEKKNYLLLSAVFIGIGILIKVYVLFFVFTYTLFLTCHYYKNKRLNRKDFKKIFIFLAVVFIFCIPTLTHNYLLYKDKGFVDLMFTNFFKIGLERAKEVYPHHNQAGWMPPTDFKGFFFGNQWNYKDYPEDFYRLPGFIIVIVDLFKEEPIILLFGFFGLILMLYKKNEKNVYLSFFLFNSPLPFVFIGTHIPMIKHLTFLPLLLAPFAAFFLIRAWEIVRTKLPKFRIVHLLFLIVLFNLIFIGRTWGSTGYVYSQSAESQLINYKMREMESSSLIIVDGRIYVGFSLWMFNDKHFLNVNLLNEMIERSKQYNSSPPVSIITYFIECVRDDCGWGTIKNQPEFNKSMEDFTLWFSNNSRLVKEIKTEDYRSRRFYLPFLTEHKPITVYNIYKTNLLLNPAILPMSNFTHFNINGFPLGYNRAIGNIFDDYETHTGLDRLIDKLAHLILYCSIALCFLVMFFLIYLFVIEENETFYNNPSI
jgi:hypothetical protein